MSVRYWVGVVAEVNTKFAVETGVCAFTKGQKAPLSKLSEGDRFACYSPKTGFMEGEPVQAFTALGTVIDPTPFEIDWDGQDIWVCKAAYAAITPAPVRPLLEPLAFVTNPAKWGMAFRRGMFEITESDFDLIETAMKSKAS